MIIVIACGAGLCFLGMIGFGVYTSWKLDRFIKTLDTPEKRMEFLKAWHDS